LKVIIKRRIIQSRIFAITHFCSLRASVFFRIYSIHACTRTTIFNFRAMPPTTSPLLTLPSPCSPLSWQVSKCLRVLRGIVSLPPVPHSSGHLPGGHRGNATFANAGEDVARRTAGEQEGGLGRSEVQGKGGSAVDAAASVAKKFAINKHNKVKLIASLSSKHDVQVCCLCKCVAACVFVAACICMCGCMCFCACAGICVCRCLRAFVAACVFVHVWQHVSLCMCSYGVTTVSRID